MAVASLLALEPKRSKRTGDPGLIVLRPPCPFNMEHLFEYVADCHRGPMLDETSDQFVPGITVVARLLLAGRLPDQALVFQPPALPCAVERDGLGPELVSISLEPGEIRPCDPDGPKASAAGLVAQV